MRSTIVSHHSIEKTTNIMVKRTQHTEVDLVYIDVFTNTRFFEITASEVRDTHVIPTDVIPDGKPADRYKCIQFHIASI